MSGDGMEARLCNAGVDVCMSVCCAVLCCCPVGVLLGAITVNLKALRQNASNMKELWTPAGL